MLSEEQAIKVILQGTVSNTGQEFFNALAKIMSSTLGYSHAWITEIVDTHHLRTMAIFVNGQREENYIYDMRGTPCESVIVDMNIEHHADNVQNHYPLDKSLLKLGARSYFGVPMIGSKGAIVGHLALLGEKPTPNEPNGLSVLKIFASRAGAELERIYVERQLKIQQQETQKILDTAMDCIITLDTDLRIQTINQSALKQFEDKDIVHNKPKFSSFIDSTSAKKLQDSVNLLLSKKTPEEHIWLPDGLKLIKRNGKDIIADITISLIEKKNNSTIVISFRNVNERIEGLKRIESLRLEQQYLKEELKKVSQSPPIIGSSPAMQEVLEQIEQVATTDASVLICGETGTGKELIANALHKSSKRKTKAFIKVNCGALQANLIESEFFGHEKGAFTGATSRRIGRFKLADGGTIFLDEIGDIPADLQVKLLRVLQEGEFEPVGSSTTQRVHVRIISATHKDLLQAVQDGEFREDLYYRLNVFPIKVPALRERGDDIITIAQTFKNYFCEQMGRSISDFDHQQITLLQSHHWPGNIRELRNIIERAVITAKNGSLDLQRALPTPTKPDEIKKVSQPEIPGYSHILNESQLRDIEKSNILRALTHCNGKISGNTGAAKLLGLKPSTLNSRIKTYDIDCDNS